MIKGKLYIVPTPIGNLADITFRALEILKNVDQIGAEDTRKSSNLLKHFNIETPMFSYHKFNERSRVVKILNKLGKGEDIAIISDAGTPGISDPAQIIIKEVLENGFVVETLPGPTAFIPALVSSGLNCDRFYFIGFLPEKEKARKDQLEKISGIRDTLIFYEAPHRLEKFLNNLFEIFGDRKVAVAREISKLYETYTRCSLSELLNSLEKLTFKGEFVIVVEGCKKKNFSEDDLNLLLKDQIVKGVPVKLAIKEVAEQTGENRNRLYKLALILKKREKH